MKGTLSNFFLFATGALVGSVVTWKIVKTKYEQIAQEEIDSVKAVFARRMGAMEEDLDNKQAEIDDYTAIIEGSNYVDKANKEVQKMSRPYVVSPDEFGEIDEYETVTLYYYADGVVTDDQDIPIEDVDSVVGIDSLNHFGEYEDDSVFVRNDEAMTDYEILLDSRKFSDVIKKNPHSAEDE